LTSAININAYSDALVVLGTAGVVVPIVRRWGFSPVLAYFGAGALLGPLGLGSFISSVPVLHWFTVVDAKNISGIAELGVVFLLFLIGLELSFERLLTMRRLVFGLGGLQVLATGTLVAAVLIAIGQKPAVAAIVGASLSLSSTAIVLELLSAQGRLSTTTGRSSFAVLLAQDLAVIPILVFISIFEIGSGGSVIAGLATALVQAAVGIAAITLIGRYLLRPMFETVASAHSTDLFVAAVLIVIVGAGVVAYQAGLSMAIGAFVAGLMLAETEYGKAIEATIEPFKTFLLGVFFFTVGMNIDLRELIREPLWLLAAVVALIAAKAAVLIGLGRLFRLPWAAAIETGLLLGPGGEFAFISIGMASELTLVNARVSSFTLAVTSITMALLPVLSMLVRRVTTDLPDKTIDPELRPKPGGNTHHAIVVGYGRVGKVVASLLSEHGVPYIAIDYDAVAITKDRRDGHLVYYGNASDTGVLETCGLSEAIGIIITIQSYDKVDQVVARVRAKRPDIPIISRARDAHHARHLYAIGATDVVPETIEASLQLSEATLVGLGVPTGKVIASIHGKRDEFRQDLQRAATDAGRTESRSIRAKTRNSPSK
jgi:CPA2 family monovalent cation:H+ antiporter-2